VTAGLVTDGESLFVATLDGKLFAFDSGTLKTRFKITGFEAGIYASPVIANGVIYVVDNAGNVSARATSNLKRRLWRVPTSRGVRAAPVVQGPDLVVVSTAGEVTVIRRATGDEVAKYKLAGTFSHPPATAGDDGLVFATEHGVVRGVDRVTGTIRWSHELGAAPGGPGTVRGRGVFYSPKSRELVAIDAKTGEVMYQTGTNSAAGTAEADRIFFVAGNVLSAFAPGADGYGLVWSFEARGRILAGPLVDEKAGTVYIGDERGNFYLLGTDG
jgi:outer membrane protein assembly factor BamB